MSSQNASITAAVEPKKMHRSSGMEPTRQPACSAPFADVPSLLRAAGNKVVNLQINDADWPECMETEAITVTAGVE